MSQHATRRVTLGLAVGDLLCIGLAHWAAIIAVTDSLTPGWLLSSTSFPVIAGLCWFAFATRQHLFSTVRTELLGTYLNRTAKAFFGAAAVTVLVLAVLQDYAERLFLDQEAAFARNYYLIFCGFFLGLILMHRSVSRFLLQNLRRHGFNIQRILIVGSNDRAKSLIKHIVWHKSYGLALVGYLDDEPLDREWFRYSGVRYQGRFSRLNDVLQTDVVDEVYVALPISSHFETIHKISATCEEAGVVVRYSADLFPLYGATAEPECRQGQILLSLSYSGAIAERVHFSKLAELIAGIAVVAALSPLVVVIALLLTATGRRPRFERAPVRLPHGEVRHLLRFRVSAAPTNADGEDRSASMVDSLISDSGLDDLPQIYDVISGRLSAVDQRVRVRQELAWVR